jgi:hypothetical protein
LSQETNREDLTILAAIEALERGDDPAAASGPRGDETAETLARLYTEVLGLVPAELEPVTPRPEARERLLAALGVAGAARAVDAAPAAQTPLQASEPRLTPVAVPIPPVDAAPAPAPAPDPISPVAPIAPAPAAQPAPVRPMQEPRQPYGPAPRPGFVQRRQSRWPLAAAASLALLFAGTTAWLWIGRVDQDARMAELLDRVEAQRRMAGEATAEAEQLRNEMGNMRERYALVTSPNVQVMPMRPVGEQPRARGMLFVGADRQHWYMALEGLEPAGAGAVYQLWWVTDQGILSGGSFTAESGEKIQMSADEMPSGTRQAIVTFEPAGIVPAPTGPQILRAGP